MTVETPQNVSTSSPDNVTPENNVNNTPSEGPKTAPIHKPSPAQDLRDIQMLLVQGIFPGQVAPAVVKAYSVLEQMAKQVEADAEKQPS